MTTLVVLSVVDIVLLIAGLAFYLFDRRRPARPGRHATSRSAPSSCATIVRNAALIVPGVEHINRTGGVVAGALPLLYGMAEGIVAGVTYQAPAADAGAPAGRAGLGHAAAPASTTPSATAPPDRRIRDGELGVRTVGPTELRDRRRVVTATADAGQAVRCWRTRRGRGPW